MPAPSPIRIVHFTHVRNLKGIIAGGLRSDAACRREGRTEVEIGSARIRERRYNLSVGNVGPGGCVGDYVPWYFGPRSPMMYTLSEEQLRVPRGVRRGASPLSRAVPRIVALGTAWTRLGSERGLNSAEFTDDENAAHGSHKLGRGRGQYWTDYPDGADLRAAEFLAHGSVAYEGDHARLS